MKGRKKNRLIVGITGSFGSGKTTVAELLKKQLGACLINADRIAHDVLKEKNIRDRLSKYFGDKIVGKDSNINTKALAKIVFNDRKSLEKLNQIMHPEIIRIIKEKINASKRKLIVLDAPLLIESSLHRIVNKIILVKTDITVQTTRLKKRGFSEEEIKARISKQLPFEEKIRFADFVVDNNESLKKTRQQVMKIARRLKLWKKQKS